MRLVCGVSRTKQAAHAKIVAEGFAQPSCVPEQANPQEGQFSEALRESTMVKVRLPYLCAIIALTLTELACGPGPTAGDLQALEEARSRFQGVFDIQPRGSIYIEAQHLLGGCPEEREALLLHKILLLGPDNSRRSDSNYVYLNLWEGPRRFCYQLYFSRSSGVVERSSQAYY